MAPEVKYNEDIDAYELGDEIDGVFYTFVRITGEQVRSHVANVKENEQQAAAEAPATGTS